MNCKPSSAVRRPARWPAACSTLAALTLLTACGSVPVSIPLLRQIPEPPAYLVPVAVPAPKVGESPVLDAERNAQAVKRANRIIRACKADWQALSGAYRAPEPRKSLIGRGYQWRA